MKVPDRLILKLSCYLLTFCLLSCLTNEEVKSDGIEGLDKKTDFKQKSNDQAQMVRNLNNGDTILVTGTKVTNPQPLPSLTPIYLIKKNGKGASKKILAFRAWDFNGDGHFDLVDVVGADGSVVAELYDLDFDGVVDFQNKKIPPSE